MGNKNYTFGAPEYPKRGGIYYVEIPFSTGHEMMKDRPGIVVSCNPMNRNSGCVSVVLCSSHAANKDLPSHVTVRSMTEKSIAMCQHIYTVDKSRLGRYMGRVTAMELQQIDIALMSYMGLGDYVPIKDAQQQEAPEPDADPIQEEVTAEAPAEPAVSTALTGHTDRTGNAYQDICEMLMERIMRKAGL